MGIARSLHRPPRSPMPWMSGVLSHTTTRSDPTFIKALSVFSNKTRDKTTAACKACRLQLYENVNTNTAACVRRYHS